jgi:hypothetical protein
MARSPKTTCLHCDQKMAVGLSFCSSCGRPTPNATHAERVEWELSQWSSARPKRTVKAVARAMPTVVVEPKISEDIIPAPAPTKPLIRLHPRAPQIAKRETRREPVMASEPAEMTHAVPAAKPAARAPKPKTVAKTVAPVNGTKKPAAKKTAAPAPNANARKPKAPAPKKPSKAAAPKKAAKAPVMVEAVIDLTEHAANGHSNGGSTNGSKDINLALREHTDVLQSLVRRIDCLDEKITAMNSNGHKRRRWFAKRRG